MDFTILATDDQILRCQMIYQLNSIRPIETSKVDLMTKTDVQLDFTKY